MRTKASNSTLNLVHPPIDNVVLLQGAMDDVVIGSHVPNVGFFTDLTDTSLVGAPLVGTTSSGMLTQVFLGDGLEIVTINNQKVLIRTGSALPTGYGEGPYSEGSFGQILSE